MVLHSIFKFCVLINPFFVSGLSKSFIGVNKFSVKMSSIPVSPADLKDKIAGALLGFYVGDALAMPVHWYYDLNQLRRDFGAITKYESPKVFT
jgi:hypothetical protein